MLSQVKLHLRQQLFRGALNFLRERLSQVDWAFSSSSFTLEALHATPLKAIPSFSRLAILRWIIDSEPDVHFRLRPHFTRILSLSLWMWPIFLPYTHSGSSLAPSITRTSLSPPYLDFTCLSPPCLPHSRAFSANNILLFPPFASPSGLVYPSGSPNRFP